MSTLFKYERVKWGTRMVFGLPIRNTDRPYQTLHKIVWAHEMLCFSVRVVLKSFVGFECPLHYWHISSYCSNNFQRYFFNSIILIPIFDLSWCSTFNLFWRYSCSEKPQVQMSLSFLVVPCSILFFVYLEIIKLAILTYFRLKPSSMAAAQLLWKILFYYHNWLQKMRQQSNKKLSVHNE